MPPESIPVPGTGEYLESRLTEEMFRRYEPLLAKAVAAFPSETSFTVPPGISPTTFVARFRDARFSYLKFDWPSQLIDRDKLLDIQGKHTISLDPSSGLVWFRAKQRRGRPTEFVTEATTHTSALADSTPRRWSDWSVEEVRALCLLLHTKKLTGPFVLRGKVTPDFTDAMTTAFDVSLAYQQDTDETVIL